MGSRLGEHFGELDLPSIGPKIAAFYLRDLVSVFELESFLRAEDYYFIQPNDTWVDQISEKLGITNKEDSREVKIS